MHAGSRYFGHPWKKGDVVGCMINMEEKFMIFTLNGELLITNKGSELCFADFETEDGECRTLVNISANSFIYSVCFLHAVSRVMAGLVWQLAGKKYSKCLG